MLWNLHFWPRPGGGVGPVNLPQAIEDMMANLHIHTFSYMLQEQTAAQQIRKVAEEQLVRIVQNLDKMHQESVKHSRRIGPKQDD